MGMQAFQKRSAASHAKSALARKALAARIASNAKSVSRMLRDAVATDARAQLALKAETAKASKKTNMRVDAYATQMRKDAKAARSQLTAITTGVIAQLRAHEAKVSQAVSKFASKDKARQQASLRFAAAQLKIADKDLAAARAQATNQVRQLRKDFATQMVTVTAEVKNVETRLVGEIAVVSGEVISDRANQLRINRRVSTELKRIVRVSDRRFSASKRARGKLKLLMDENKAAASAEVAALATSLKQKLAKARARNARNRREMAKDLTSATKNLYERMNNMQKRNIANAASLARATSAASMASANALKRAKGQFASKISMLTNVIAANAKRAKRDLTRVTGVVNSIARAAAADRRLIRDQTRAMKADLNRSVVRAIAIGEARAKAVE